MKLTGRLKRAFHPPLPLREGDRSFAPAVTTSNGHATDEHTRRLAALRREMTRITERTALHRPPREQPAIPAHPATPRIPARAAVDPAGMLYQQTFSRSTPLGQEHLGALAENLPLVQTLLEQMAKWTPETAPLCREDLLFLDIETTGLSRAAGTLAILVGLGFFTGGQGSLQIDQLFLREPGLEPQLLDRLEGYLKRARVLITFNGQSFDLPILRNRALLQRRSIPLLSCSHLDLLPLCRRIWRRRLDNCRLATLERQVLGFYRANDIDGAAIPAVYVEFLRSGRTDEIDRVLEHNLLDVAVMVSVLTQVSRHLLLPLHWAEDGEELLSTGQFHLQRGQLPLGEACLKRGLELAQLPSTRQRLSVMLAEHLRRSERLDEAVSLWEAYRTEFPQSNRGWVELAKYHEHVTKDLPRALALAENAPHQNQAAHQRRVERLRRRTLRHFCHES